MSQDTTELNRSGQIEELPAGLALKLQVEASRNPALMAVCKIFSLRERTRSQVTLRTLMATLHHEGFDVIRPDIARALRWLAGQGIGEIYEKDGKVESLRDIKYSLFAISYAALAGLSPNKPALMTPDDVKRSDVVRPAAKTGQATSHIRHLTNVKGVPLSAKQEVATTPATPVAKTSHRAAGDVASLTVVLGGNTLSFQVSSDEAKALVKDLLSR